MSNEFINHLNIFGAKVEKAMPRINSGGCAVFATLVAERLRKHFDTRIRTAGYVWDNARKGVDEARAIIKRNSLTEWQGAGISFGHVIVEFDCDGDTFHYDTTGVIPAAPRTKAFDFEVFDGHFSVEEMRVLALDSGGRGWNNEFDHRSLTPTLKFMVKQFFMHEDFAFKVKEHVTAQ